MSSQSTGDVTIVVTSAINTIVVRDYRAKQESAKDGMNTNVLGGKSRQEQGNEDKCDRAMR